MKDDEIWFAVNEALGRQQLFQGGVLVAAGLGSFLLGSARQVQMVALVGCALFSRSALSTRSFVAYR